MIYADANMQLNKLRKYMHMLLIVPVIPDISGLYFGDTPMNLSWITCSSKTFSGSCLSLLPKFFLLPSPTQQI
jgi:hypothetical protein